MFLDKESYPDFKKYYLNTYIKLKETGDNLYWVDRVDEEYTTLLSMEDSEKILLSHENGYNVDFILPRKASFLHKNVLYHLARTPARQWKKGICKENTTCAYLAHTGKWTSGELTNNVITSYCQKNIFFPLESINSSTFGNRFALPIDTRFSLDKTGKLWLDMNFIGEINITTRTIKINKIFQYEVENIFDLTKIYTVSYHD